MCAQIDIDLQISGAKGSESCLIYNAARLWPYRLVAHMLQRAVTRGVNLHTNTPVTSITPGDIHSTSPTWVVNTPRGSLKCHTIIHATNGYVSALVPELQSKIVPVKGIVARLIPTGAPRLTESYMMRFSDYEYDYMIPRPDGSIVVGGGRRDYYHDLNKWFDVSDDGSLIQGAEKYFDGYMQRHFRGWEDCDVRTEDLWTGSESLSSCLIITGNAC
jgi:glycine/D-amino acid oxidase-like deaminating enzyme